MEKISLLHLSILQIQSILKSYDWSQPFFTMPTLETFKLIFIKLYQHAKNKLIPFVNSILESSDQIGHINKP